MLGASAAFSLYTARILNISGISAAGDPIVQNFIENWRHFCIFYKRCSSEEECQDQLY